METEISIDKIDKELIEALDKPKKKNPPRITNEEKISILLLHKNGMGITEIARKIKRSEAAVSKYLASMIDSTELAKATLRAGAVNLAERIIKKADVKEAIEVLSRPNIGVIDAPAGKQGSFGIQVSVGVGSCGTVVKVEAGNVGEQRALEGGATGDSKTGIPREIQAIEASASKVSGE